MWLTFLFQIIFSHFRRVISACSVHNTPPTSHLSFLYIQFSAAVIQSSFSLKCLQFLKKKDIQANSSLAPIAMGFSLVLDSLNIGMHAIELMQDPLHEIHHLRQFITPTSMVWLSCLPEVWNIYLSPSCTMRCRWKFPATQHSSSYSPATSN